MSTPQDAWKQLQRMANRAGGGGRPQAPKGFFGGAAGLIILGGAAVVANNALFNVDGGHRAIKYTRLGGVGKEIYSEGMCCPRGATELHGNANVRSRQERISESRGLNLP